METPDPPESPSVEQKREISRRVLGVLCASVALGLKYGELLRRVFRGKVKEAFAKKNCPWRAAHEVYQIFSKGKS